MSPTDDLADLFAGPPPGPSSDMRYRQGTVLTFNPATLANTVDVGGTTCVNLPLLGVSEATLLMPGSVVGIASMQSQSGAATWAIIGRLVTPQTPAAIEAITQLAQNIASQQVNDPVTTSNISYEDLGGPLVTVKVRASGSLLIILGAEVQADAEIGIMSFEMTGSNVRAPDDEQALYVYVDGAFADLAMSRVIQVDGLNPGSTTIAARYHIGGVGTGVTWVNRTVTALAL